MKTKIILLCIAITSIIGCSKIIEDLPVVQEINSNWEFRSDDSPDWRSATIPGNVYTDLLDHKIIPDPFIKTNEEKVQWVATKNWEYKTTFNISEDELQKEFIELNFEGLDTYAKVYVNNQLLITTNNAFRNYKLDIKEQAKKVNELRIAFTNTDKIAAKKEKNNRYKLPEGKRIYTRKAQFQYGWDWGPKLNTSGIWKAVTLKTWNAIQFDDIYIKQQKVTSENANFEIEFTIESHSDTNVNIFITANKQSYAKHIKLR